MSRTHTFFLRLFDNSDCELLVDVKGLIWRVREAELDAFYRTCAMMTMVAKTNDQPLDVLQFNQIGCLAYWFEDRFPKDYNYFPFLEHKSWREIRARGKFQPGEMDDPFEAFKININVYPGNDKPDAMVASGFFFASYFANTMYTIDTDIILVSDCFDQDTASDYHIKAYLE